MKKEEIISLGLAIVAVILMPIGLSFDYGVWRTSFVILSVVSLLVSMGAFKQGDPNRMERILRIVFFSAFALVILFSLVYTGFTDGHDGWAYLLFVALLLGGSGFFAYFYIWGKGWLNMRASWLDVDSPPASKEGRGKAKTFTILPIDHRTSCVYSPSSKQLQITHKLFTDPLKHEEELQERVFKFGELFDETGLSIDWEINGEDSLFSFDLIMSIPKRLATKKNMVRIKELLETMSADDPHLFIRLDIDNEVWFIEVFRNIVRRSKVYILSENEAEIETGEESEEEVHAKHHAQELFEIMLSGDNLDDVKEIYLIPQEDFEKIFNDDDDE